MDTRTIHGNSASTAPQKSSATSRKSWRQSCTGAVLLTRGWRRCSRVAKSIRLLTRGTLTRLTMSIAKNHNWQARPESNHAPPRPQRPSFYCNEHCRRSTSSIRWMGSLPSLNKYQHRYPTYARPRGKSITPKIFYRCPGTCSRILSCRMRSLSNPTTLRTDPRL